MHALLLAVSNAMGIHVTEISRTREQMRAHHHCCASHGASPHASVGRHRAMISPPFEFIELLSGATPPSRPPRLTVVECRHHTDAGHVRKCQSHAARWNYQSACAITDDEFDKDNDIIGARRHKSYRGIIIFHKMPCRQFYVNTCLKYIC